MNNSAAIKTLVTFAILVPVAILLGYMLQDPLSYSSFAVVSVILAVMLFPLVLKWHQPLLLLSWNMGVIVPFIKGQPNLWLLMAMISLGIAILDRTLSREMKFVQVPSLTLPLLGMIGVVLVTAKLTGGLGLRAFGSDVYGGRKYIILISSIAAYFALTAWRIPPKKAGLYVGLFFLGSVVNLIGDLYYFAPTGLRFIFWFIPPSGYVTENALQGGTARWSGVCGAAQAILFLILLRFGIRGIFLSGKPLRVVFFSAFMGLSMLGGFRSAMLTIVLILTFLYFLEKLHRTKLIFAFALAAILGGALLVPFAKYLPFTFQRGLAFLPIEIQASARLDAESSSQWRLDMWQALLPLIPKYFWLGKGYAISQEDFQMMGFDSSFHAIDASQQGLALAGDYHNGPLSVIIPFGIWGALIFVWFLAAGFRVIYRNYRYGDEALKRYNSFLVAYFLAKLILFCTVFGALSGDMWIFAGIFGLSVSLNNGMARKPVEVPVEVPDHISCRRLLSPRPSFQR